MIEFAPNPSGPAHLGTLRTYAVAWLLARRMSLPLFVRFDARRFPNSEAWSQRFLDDMAQLDLSPDGWHHFAERMVIGDLPVWGIIRDQPGRRLACYPELPRPRRVPSYETRAYQVGLPVPMLQAPAEIAYDVGTFAVMEKDAEVWEVQSGVVKLLNMQLRSVKVIVRGLNCAWIRPVIEAPAHRWFGVAVPRMHLTSMVVGRSQALRKSHLTPGDVGTVGWAMDLVGATTLRARVLASAALPHPPPVIAIETMLRLEAPLEAREKAHVR